MDEYTNSGDGYYDYYCNALDYTWVNGEMTTVVETYKTEHQYPDGNYSNSSTNTTKYAYGDGKVTVTLYEEDGQTPWNQTIIEEDGTTRKTHCREFWEGTTENIYISSYLQTEDISFVRPNLKADVEGMTADSTIVVSVAGRMVCAYEDENNSGFGHFICEDDNNTYYINTASGSTYFTVEHDGNETVCSDIKERPVYILTDGRLTKEYIYYPPLSSPSVPDEPQAQATAMRAASIPEGQAYDEITYVYDADGRLAGKTEVSVDENGTRTEEITLEYKYDEASGIASVEADAKVGVTLDGRRIGLSDNSAFSVCTVGGQVIAAGVTSYTFNSPGIYIINAGGITTKVAVK